MSTKKKGDAYEDFVAEVYSAILQAGEEGVIKNLRLEQNIQLSDKFGNDRQVDVYWEYELAGQVYKTVVECRDHASTIPISQVEAFVTKVNSLNVSKGIIATKKGFQSGAQNVAKQNGISLIVIREVEDKDWDGQVRQINLKIHISMPPEIKEVMPWIDGAWLDENMPDFDGNLKFSPLNKDVSITNYEDGRDLTLYEIAQNYLPSDVLGEHTLKKELNDSFLLLNGRKYKLIGLIIKYKSFGAIVEEVMMDLSAHVKAIMDYVTEQKKVAVLQDGTEKKL